MTGKNNNSKPKKFVTVLMTLFSTVSCGSKSSDSSLRADDDASFSDNSSIEIFENSNSNSNSSEHVDGESSIYYYSSSCFSEFKDFVSDFFISNSASFISFNLDRYDDILSTFIFEGYPSPTGMTRNDVLTTSFKCFKFSFSFYEERQNTIGIDNSRMIEVNEALLINPGDFDHDSLSYLIEEGGLNKVNVLIYSNETLVSSPTISFNGEFSWEDVNNYCEMLIDRIVLFKGDRQND